ncbi:hypothetical protein HDU96_008655 [Phlyctochytrium bullatum]|nr:hypothetical protein HDU96_008655 [Phlyctochytrium bullatum]
MSANVSSYNSNPSDKGKTILPSCCGLSLQRGAKIIVILELVNSALGIANTVWNNLYPAAENLDRTSTGYLALYYLTLIFYGVMLPVNIIGLVGIFGVRLNLVRFYAIASVVLVPFWAVPGALSGFILKSDIANGTIILGTGIVVALILAVRPRLLSQAYSI